MHTSIDKRHKQHSLSASHLFQVLSEYLTYYSSTSQIQPHCDTVSIDPFFTMEWAEVRENAALGFQAIQTILTVVQLAISQAPNKNTVSCHNISPITCCAENLSADATRILITITN